MGGGGRVFFIFDLPCVCVCGGGGGEGRNKNPLSRGGGHIFFIGICGSDFSFYI